MKHEKDGKWMCALNVDCEDWSYTNAYNTKEEAIDAGREAIKRYNLDPANEYIADDLAGTPNEPEVILSFAVGQAHFSCPFVDVDALLERSQEMAWDEGGEYAGGYLDDVTEEHKNELKMLITDWFVRHDYLPTFFKIYNVEEVKVEESE